VVTITQTLTIKLTSETLTAEQLIEILDRGRDPIAIFVLNLLASDEIKGELQFERRKQT
jgi:hypothetical protein